MVTDSGCFLLLLGRLHTNYMHPTTFCNRPCGYARVWTQKDIAKKASRGEYDTKGSVNMNVVQVEQEVKLSNRDKQESLCFHTCEDTPGVH